MEHPSSPRADAAYARALAAFKEKSYDVARRWANETLAHSPTHAGARELLARLDASRPAPSPFDPTSSGSSEVISTDPTVLISRAGAPPRVDPVDPTVVASRHDARRHTADTDAGWMPPRTPAPPSRPAPQQRPSAQPRHDSPGDEPTIMAPPRGRTPSKSTAKGTAGAWGGVGEWLRGARSGGSQASSRPGGKSVSPMSTPAARGALLAIGTVLAGALLVWVGYVGIGILSPDGQALTITKPLGGTIIGPGIECGTGGNRCEASIATGESIELDTRPDNEFVFAGYTGDCAPTGRMAMTEPKTCGAKFDRVVTSTQASTFRLTINKPEGGTIVGAGGILCGVNGSTCTADIPSGLPVSLKGEAAEGFSWDSFTGDCPSTGEMQMTGPKTCGAIFIRSAAPMNPGPRPGPGPSAPVRRPTPAPVVVTPPAPAPNPAPGPAPSTPPGGGLSSGQTGPPPAPGPDKPAERPITQEEHAKREIGQLVKKYCAALDSLNPATVRKLFHLDNERQLRDQYREYKSLKCTVTSPAEYDRLDASEAGGAQLRFGMKQVLEMKSGGAPGPTEYIVTMVVSRKGFQTEWLIDRVNYEVRPK